MRLPGNRLVGASAQSPQCIDRLKGAPRAGLQGTQSLKGPPRAWLRGLSRPGRNHGAQLQGTSSLKGSLGPVPNICRGRGGLVNPPGQVGRCQGRTEGSARGGPATASTRPSPVPPRHSAPQKPRGGVFYNFTHKSFVGKIFSDKRPLCPPDLAKRSRWVYEGSGQQESRVVNLWVTVRYSVCSPL